MSDKEIALELTKLSINQEKNLGTKTSFKGKENIDEAFRFHLKAVKNL